MFQSTPHLSGKANAILGHSCISQQSFNPRLTSAARRTPLDLFRLWQSERFNPRLTSAARRTRWIARPLFSARFQSTPHLSGKANRLRGEVAPFNNGFNPRLTSAARRTEEHCKRKAGSISFNPRLTSAARRTRHIFAFLRL